MLTMEGRDSGETDSYLITQEWRSDAQCHSPPLWVTRWPSMTRPGLMGFVEHRLESHTPVCVWHLLSRYCEIVMHAAVW